MKGETPALARVHLAQANIARMLAPLDDPVMAEFVAWLEPVNALADASPGFVWRLQTEDGDATAIRAFADPLILFNLSVWESVEALEAYVYRSDHVHALRQRKQWFRPAVDPQVVLWWVRAGQPQSIDEAKKRLDLLRERGPTAEAFTFTQRFAPPPELSLLQSS